MPAVACPRCQEPVVPGAQYCPGCGLDVSGPQGNRTTMQVPPSSAALSNAYAEMLGRLREATLGDYDIMGELGRGGMATVYLAHDIALGRKVAIKVMHPALLLGAGMQDRFKREARTAASLTHPHIIPIHAVRETSHILYFVMKYVEGRSLDTIIAQEGPLPIKMAQAVLMQVGGALGYAHRQGVVHRDVKPANIMIDTEGWAVITDFGIAKVAEAGSLTMSGTTVGTPSYMSPEQCSARPVTGASDQYSLGIVGFEMLAGKTPFAGDSLMDIMRKHFFEPPPPLAQSRPDCPPALAGAISRMLMKMPEQRWPRIEDAIDAMGVQPLGHDDPVRTHMIALAKSGIRPVAQMPPPSSPTPLGKPPFAKPSKTPHGPTPKSKTTLSARSRPVERSVIRRLLPWLLTAAMATAVAVAAYLFLHPPFVAPSITNVEILEVPVAMEIGQSAQLLVRVRASDGSLRDSVPVTWTTSDSSIAVVSEGGVLVGLHAGNARVTASSGGTSASTEVAVRSTVATLAIAPRTTRMSPGDTLVFAVSGRDAAGRRIDGLAVSWSSTPTSVLRISASGVATAVQPGSATVTVSSGSKSATATITVMRPGAASLTIIPGRVSVLVGQTARLSTVARDASGRTVQSAVTWRSLNPRVASVSSDGVATGLSPGTANIQAAGAGLTSPAAFVVVTPPSPAILRLLVRPWATVTIDGVRRGQMTRVEDTLSAGVPHRIQLEGPGFAPFDTTITLQGGATVPLQIQMKRLP